MALDLDHADCAGLFYNTEIQSFIPQSIDEKLSEATAASTGGSNSRRRSSSGEAAAVNNKVEEMPNDVEGGGDGELWQAARGEIGPQGTSTAEQQEGYDGEKEQHQEQQEGTWPEEAGWRHLRESFSRAVATARRLSTVQTEEQQQPSVSYLASGANAAWKPTHRKSKGSWAQNEDKTIFREPGTTHSDVGFEAAEHTKHGGGGDADEEGGKWEWSEGEGWHSHLGDGISQALALVEQPEAAISLTNQAIREDRVIEYEPRLSESCSEWKSYSNKNCDGGEVDAQKWVQTPDGEWVPGPQAVEPGGYNEGEKQQLQEYHVSEEDSSRNFDYQRALESTENLNHGNNVYVEDGEGVPGRASTAVDGGNDGDDWEVAPNIEHGQEYGYDKQTPTQVKESWLSSPYHLVVKEGGDVLHEEGGYDQVGADDTQHQERHGSGWENGHVDGSGFGRDGDTQGEHHTTRNNTSTLDKPEDEEKALGGKNEPATLVAAEEGTGTPGKPSSWNGIAGMVRAKNRWMSLVDRESGSVYYQNEQSGLTQWEAPEDGAVVVPEDVYGDDASIQ